MKAVVTICIGVAFGLPAWADPLVYDNFSGPVANASGQFPTIGAYPWSCTGPSAANCVRGGGALTASGATSTIYYTMQATATPLQVSYQFTDAVEAPSFVIAVTRDGSLNNMWHANGYNDGSSFIFAQTYWCASTAICSSPQANAVPQSVGISSGPCPATVPNRTYLGKLNIYGDTAVATLQDAATGNVLCFNTASDPALRNVIGPNFFLETYYASPNVVFTSVQADAAPFPLLSPQLQSGSVNVKAVASAFDIMRLKNGNSIDSIFNLAPSQVPETLALLSGEIASSSSGAGLSISTTFMDTMLNPLHGTGPARLQEAQRLSGKAAGRRNFSARKFDAWLGAYGTEDSRESDPVLGSHAGNQSQSGVSIGLDYMPSGSLLIGGAVGQARLNWNLGGLASSGQADVTHGGVYLSILAPNGYANIGFTYSALGMRTRRTVQVDKPNQYKAGFDATDMNARFEVGNRLLGRNAGYSLMQFAAIDLQRFEAPLYQETTVLGNPSYALAIKAQDKNQMFTDLGLRIERGAVNTARFNFTASLAWRHILSPSRSATANFLGDPASVFTVWGSSADSDAAVASMAGNFRLGKGFFLGVTAAGAFGGNGSRYGASAMLHRVW